jgi:glutamyl-tRNA synthetase
MTAFLFKEPEVPPKEEIIPKKLNALKTRAVLEAAKSFVPEAAKLEKEWAEELARTTADTLGIKLGDFMMPIRLAVTGSRISPPLIGSLAALGAEKALARIDRALRLF